MENQNKPWQEYPRPQLKRENWRSLNGIWELDGREIRVPFPPQAKASGYEASVEEYMVYRRNFQAKRQFGKRVILHFGAVDQHAEVYVNGSFLGRHEGGYLPFSYDITEHLSADGENLLEVQVADALDQRYPYGKQRKNRGGMWYTPVSGIWKSVWLEQVPEVYIKWIRMTSDLRGIRLELAMAGETEVERLPAALEVQITLDDGRSCGNVWLPEWNTEESKAEPAEEIISKTEIYLDLMELGAQGDGASSVPYVPRLWSPEDPYLYQMTLWAREDRVETYFALRTVENRQIDGVWRVCLNGQPVFMNGVLDQGYYPEGIYVPAEEREYERDILRMKELGMNCIRKHLKVEPECFYYYCDLHGMLVMQDMVNSGRYSFFRDTLLPTLGLTRLPDKWLHKDAKQRMIFEQHMMEEIAQLYNHPCIVAYTIFNEGWGQFDSDRMYDTAKAADPTRLYDTASGWFTGTRSDFDSIHIYFGFRRPRSEGHPALLSEFGGYSYAVPEHVFTRRQFGYGACRSTRKLMERIRSRYEQLVFPYIEKGLCGCIYTQVSDIEDETNGFYTYDRAVCKADPEEMRLIAAEIRRRMGNDGQAAKQEAVQGESAQQKM